jgi:hypothetical protein
MSRIIKNVCLLVRYLAMDVLVLLRAKFGNVFTEPLPSNGHTRHNIIFVILVTKCKNKDISGMRRREIK